MRTTPGRDRHWLYESLFRVVFARMDPEQAHHRAFAVIRAIPILKLDGIVSRLTRPNRDLRVETLGLSFPSPFGVAAGFDKEGHGVLGLSALGFGHVEVGTITAHAQPGNPKTRLFRLIPDRAVINRMGFNNDGAPTVARRLAKLSSAQRENVVLGVNIGKSRVTSVDDAISDYVTSTRDLAPVADYLVVNVSSPNTPGLRGLQELDRLEPLLRAVQRAAGSTPLLVKIAPDVDDDQLDRISQLVVDMGLDGIIATNTTISRDGLRSDPNVVAAAGAGGLSGAPLAQRSLDVLRRVRKIVPEELCVISVGGVETAEDVIERLDAGATLVQGYTGFLYRGPLWARAVNRGVERIRRERASR